MNNGDKRDFLKMNKSPRTCETITVLGFLNLQVFYLYMVTIVHYLCQRFFCVYLRYTTWCLKILTCSEMVTTVNTVIVSQVIVFRRRVKRMLGRRNNWRNNGPTFSNLVKDINLQIQESECSSSRINFKEATLKRIIIKLLKTNNKEKLLKSAREKPHIINWWKMI